MLQSYERFPVLGLVWCLLALTLIAILQRVASASVTVDKTLVSSIGKGVLVFAAVAPDDTPKEVESMAAKVLKLKMWPDAAGGTVKPKARTSLYRRRKLTWAVCEVETKCPRHPGRGTFSFTVHSTGKYEERIQARLSWSCWR